MSCTRTTRDTTSHKEQRSSDTSVGANRPCATKNRLMTHVKHGSRQHGRALKQQATRSGPPPNKHDSSSSIPKSAKLMEAGDGRTDTQPSYISNAPPTACERTDLSRRRATKIERYPSYYNISAGQKNAYPQKTRLNSNPGSLLDDTTTAWQLPGQAVRCRLPSIVCNGSNDSRRAKKLFVFRPRSPHSYRRVLSIQQHGEKV